ncbi:UMP kinase [Xylanibacter oryzae]|uniref:UMP kinase n=1 Tax=Xylanibacter oryzae TaxID=185293 RepID=UPI0004B68746|nr:UMP kinase [Xylanibacter oryzae]MBP7358026.1 UMP kinase [Prevotella sp.]
MAKYKRILLKLSGESLMGKQSFGIDPDRLADYARQIKEVHDMGVQIGIVIGGGNIFRGLSGTGKGFDRVKGDQMGMCATVINSLALSSAIGTLGIKTKVMTAIRMEPIGEFYNKWNAIEYMEQDYVCIFSAGTGNPYFTTDTGSSLRGIEIEADVMLKGTRVDGIYTADPEKDPFAKKFKDITYDDIYTRGLKVMDLTATTMCKENDLPIYVFNMDIFGNLKKVIEGEEIGTLVHN